jgi:Uma2 family endonuclease
MARLPDLMIYKADRMADYKASDPEWRKKPFVLVPDLCIEVVSPNDTYIDVDEKVERYLADGVKIVWVVNPRKAAVTIYSIDDDFIVKLNREKSLEENDILPGLSLRVGEIFEGL